MDMGVSQIHLGVIQYVPACDVQTAMGLLDVEPAARAALPFALPGGLNEQQILTAALPSAELRELSAAHAGVPRHRAMRAEQPPAHLALGLRHGVVVAVGHHHLGAVRERAVGPPRAGEHGLAQRGAPPLEHVDREGGAAQLWIESAGAGCVEASHGGGGAGLDLGADVARKTRWAEGVRAGAATAVDLRGRHFLVADAAGILRLLRGIRHWRRYEVFDGLVNTDRQILSRLDLSDNS